MKQYSIIIIILTILVLPLIPAVKECQSINTPNEIPCQITTTWQPSNNCNTYEAKLYNESAHNIQNLTIGTFGPTNYCNVTFNQTKRGSYFLNMSTGDTATIHVAEQANMVFTAIILVPLILSIIALVGAATLGEEHQALKIFLFLFSILPFFMSMYLGFITVIQYYDFPIMQEGIGAVIFWVSITLVVLIFYFIAYFIWKAFRSIGEKKATKYEQVRY